jgi:hypothetical protein
MSHILGEGTGVSIAPPLHGILTAYAADLPAIASNCRR